MVADNDINPLVPGWPTRTVTEKSESRNKRRQLPEQAEQEAEVYEEVSEETEKDDKKKTDPGHIDEYA